MKRTVLVPMIEEDVAALADPVNVHILIPIGFNHSPRIDTGPNEVMQPNALMVIRKFIGWGFGAADGEAGLSPDDGFSRPTRSQSSI